MSFVPPFKAGKGPVTLFAAGLVAATLSFMPLANAASDDKAADAPAVAPAAGPAAAPGGEVLGIKDPSKDPVVAKIGSQDIKRSDVMAFIATLPEQVKQQTPLQQLFPMAQEQLIDTKIINKKAADAKLESDPEVTKLMAEAKENIIRNVYVQRELTKSVSEKDVKAVYDKDVKNFDKVEEVHAHHILVKDEATAKDIIKKLDGGAKFEDLAKQSSTDTGTAQNGGDLGYFTKDQMIPDFSKVAFSLKPGTYTEQPVKTQFGWHVIKVDDKRLRQPPKFEDVKPDVEAQARREALQSMVEKWQKEADVKKFDINGDPVKDTPKKEDKKS